MSLKETIEAEIKTAMLAKDKDSLRALRAIKSLILLEETKEGATDTLSADTEIKLLTKAAKQRRESAEIYKTQNRADLYETEMAEIAVIERFLPKQLNAEEITAAVAEIVKETGAAGMKDMGKVMGAANAKLAGKAEGKAIAEAVKAALS